MLVTKFFVAAVSNYLW